MLPEKYSLTSLKQSLKKPWTPIDVANVNDQVLRAATFEGEYHWHSHENEDEFFLVYEGRIIIETDKGTISLNTGEGVVIPKGMRHKPSSETKSLVLMFEPRSLDSEGN